MEEISDQIGERLRSARESAGLTVEDVVAGTRIPKSVVEALEAADFGVFDSPTYARSFLSQYSRFLNVDARLWLDALEPVSFAAVDVVRPSWQSPHAPKPARTPVREGPADRVSGLRGLALSCGLIFAAILVYQLFEKRFGGDAGKLQITPGKSSGLAIPPPPAAAPLPAPDPEPPKPATPGAGDAPPPRPTIVRENPLPDQAKPE